MKKIKYIGMAWGVVFALWGLQACVEDTGNYDYIDRDVIMPVKINGLKDTTVNPNELLKIEPQLEGIENENDYEYYWYAQHTNSGKRDTLARTRNLAYEMNLGIGEYVLYYEVKDAKREIYVRKTLTLTIASQLGTGWYVVKDENGLTDFDYISNQENGIRWDQVVKSSGNEPLNGEALRINYANKYTNEATLPDGTVELQYNKKVFLVGSSKDLCMFNADNMELFKDYNGLFYEAPAECHPQNFYGSIDFYLINAGKIHTIAGNYMNAGKFGYAIPGMYDLHSDMLVSPYGVTVFDKNTSTFYNTTVRGNRLNVFPEPAQGNISSANMDMELIRILPWSENGGKGYALMKDDVHQRYCIMTLEMGRVVKYPFTTIVNVPYAAGYEVFDAEVMAASEAECIYFAKDNVLKVYKNVIGEEREFVLKDFPVGETITWINALKIFDFPSLSFFYKVEVLTNSTAGWKLYSFDAIGNTPEINPEPAVVHKGKGNARYMMYRAY